MKISFRGEGSKILDQSMISSSMEKLLFPCDSELSWQISKKAKKQETNQS